MVSTISKIPLHFQPHLPSPPTPPTHPAGEASDMEEDGPRASSKQKGVKRRAAGEDGGGQRQPKRAAPGGRGLVQRPG